MSPEPVLFKKGFAIRPLDEPVSGKAINNDTIGSDEDVLAFSIPRPAAISSISLHIYLPVEPNPASPREGLVGLSEILCTPIS